MMEWDRKLLTFGNITSCKLRIIFSIYFSGGSRISQRRVRQLQKWEHQPIIFASFPQKLHEIKEIWTERGGASLVPPLGSANVFRIDKCVKQETLEKVKSYNQGNMETS